MKGNFRVRFLGEGRRGNTPPLPDNLTSQFWANCYLNPFDHFVKRELRCPGYVRFVDDLLFFGDDKDQLWDWKDAVVGAHGRAPLLRLTIHPGAHPRPVTEGFPFLGFVVYPTHRRLKSRQVAAYWRRWRALLSEYVAGEQTQDAVVASLLGWINHTRYGDTWGLRRAVAAQVTFQGPAQG